MLLTFPFLKGLSLRCWNAVGYDGSIAILPVLFLTNFEEVFRLLFLVASACGICALAWRGVVGSAVPSSLFGIKKAHEDIGRSRVNGERKEALQQQNLEVAIFEASKERGSLLVGLTLFPAFASVATSLLPGEDVGVLHDGLTQALLASSLFGALLPLRERLWVLLVPPAFLFLILKLVPSQSLGGASQHPWFCLVVSCLHICAMYFWHRCGRDSLSFSEASVLSEAFVSLLLWCIDTVLRSPFRLRLAPAFSPILPAIVNLEDFADLLPARFADCAAAFTAHLFVALFLFAAVGIFASLALQSAVRTIVIRCAFWIFCAWLGIFLFGTEFELDLVEGGLRRGSTPAAWLIETALDASHCRLLVQWGVVSVSGVIAAVLLCSRSSERQGGAGPLPAEARLACVRKVFHGVLVLNICLALHGGAREFLLLILMGTLWVLLLLETLRCTQLLPTLSSNVDLLYKKFIDSRDQGGLVFTHILLLMGAGLPLALRSSAELLGVLLVGVGDAAAAVVGATMGTHAMPFQRRKSVEGFAAFAGSSFLFGWALDLLRCGTHRVSLHILPDSNIT